MKYVIYSMVALVLIVGISYLVMHLFTRKRNVSKGRKILITALLSVVLLLGGSLAYLLPYNKAEEECYKDLESTAEITCIRCESGSTYWYAFTGPERDTALIFYPGAKIEAAAYAKLMKEIAAKGIDVYVIDFPFHMAFFNMNAADLILHDNSYENVYVGGHSLGGVAASSYARNNVDKVKGIILLASYPTAKINDKLSLLSVYGDKDGCLEMDAYNDAKLNWPANHFEEVIGGGNHAQFAQYGKQKGDNEATISAEQQIAMTSEAIVDFIKKGE